MHRTTNHYLFIINHYLFIINHYLFIINHYLFVVIVDANAEVCKEVQHIGEGELAITIEITFAPAANIVSKMWKQT